VQRHEPPPPGFLIGLQVAGSTAKLDGLFTIARGNGGVGRGPGGSGCSPFEASASALHPLLELGGDILDVESLEEVAVIECERILESPFGDELLEGHRIAAKSASAKRHFISRAEKQVGVDRPTQMMERLTQGAASFLVAQLRPEKGEERVSTDGARGREREISEQRYSLRLDAPRRGFGVASGNEADAAEGEKLAHDGATVSSRAGAGNSRRI
jgi:hypothetical protein